MTTLYIVRHCESEGNACRRSHAQYDGIITVKGAQQNEAVRKRFENVHLDAVYSSDAYRARTTAEAIAQVHHLRVKPRMLFREYSVGIWEGLPSGNVPRLYPEEWSTWYHSPWNMKVPGGDTYEVIRDRVLEGVRRVAREVGDGVAVIVTHAYTMRVLLTEAAGYPKERMGEISYGDNTAVSKLTVNEQGEFQIEFMGDSSHLPENLRRQWSGMAGKNINMAVDFCAAEEQLDQYVQLSQQLAAEQNVPFDREACLEQARKDLAWNSEAISLYSLGDSLCGMLRVTGNHPLAATHAAVAELYMRPDLREKSFDMQPLGQAFQLAREMQKSFVALPPPRTEAERALLQRFAFSQVKDGSGWFEFQVTVPGCEVPVI